MGQDKKQLTKLLAFVKDLYDHPDNKEFAAGIQAIVAADTKAAKDARFDEIYEYCIEKNARKQAKAVYSKFPITEIVDDLSADYCRMESFKRRGDFLHFAAVLFKQIERIANYICNDESYKKAFDCIKDSPALIQYDINAPMSLYSRNANSPTVAGLIFSKCPTNMQGQDKRLVSTDQQYILDKIKIALYFGGYATCIFSSSEFTKYSKLIASIYQIRCEADHGVIGRSDLQEASFQAIMKEPDFYYSEFLKVLYFYIDKISEGYTRRQELFDYASNVATQEVTLTGTVFSALAGALYIKCGGGKSELAPPSSYNRKLKFERDMRIRVTKRGGTIISIVPDNQ